jgi:hypothetical protein
MPGIVLKFNPKMSIFQYDADGRLGGLGALAALTFPV